MSTISKQKSILRRLDDGLTIRKATIEDAQALADFNGYVHGHPEEGFFDEGIAAWTRDLIGRPHPTFKPEDTLFVEDAQTGKIVSSANLISQTWTYAGIPFGVGRPELVGTLPEFRNRGLVRAQFEIIHQWSAERGERVQAITGIPYYYRIFGYEMALELSGGRAGSLSRIPRLREGESEPFRIRPAREEDIPFLAQLYQQASQRSLVSCVWTEALWRYELLEMDRQNVHHREIRIIENQHGERVGFLGHPTDKWGSMMQLFPYEIIPGLSWAAVTPTVARYLAAYGRALPTKAGEAELGEIGFWGGSDHPVYHVWADELPQIRRPYAFYMRVPDLPGFLRLIAPVLEKRLAESYLAGHTGELKITFYTGGLRLAFDKGRLAACEPWKPAPVANAGDAAFPSLTFLQLLFGFRSLEELKFAFPDCWTEGSQPHILLNALFPKQASSIWPIA